MIHHITIEFGWTCGISESESLGQRSLLQVLWLRAHAKARVVFQCGQPLTLPAHLHCHLDMSP